MSKYTLCLKTGNEELRLSLREKERVDYFEEYFDRGNGQYVYNDCAYYFSVEDEKGTQVKINDLFINNEKIEDRGFITGHKSICVFLECFGFVKLEVIIMGEAYITLNIRVAMRENLINNNIINMIDYIYDNCDDYLYEEHKYSEIESGVKSNINISIEAKLSMLGEIIDTYKREYNVLKHSAQSKPVNSNKIGNFNELRNINVNTMNYIVNHPEELQPVNYNSGIIVNKRYYQPRKTLVQSISYSYDIYENQIILGFLIMVINDLNIMKKVIEDSKKNNYKRYQKDGYIDSTYYIYNRNAKFLDELIKKIDENISVIQMIYWEYKNIFKISGLQLSDLPRYTNIFRRVMPYHAIFELIVKWINSGNYNLAKSDLILSFISVSKIYEYFCLLKINHSIENCDYELIHGFPFKYMENKYYHNTTYNNTFKFKKGDIYLTVYYQPVIYGKRGKFEIYNNLKLFRSTTISIADPNINAMLDDREEQRGNYYVPDFVLKIQKDDIENYYILDSKHSSSNNIKRYQLPSLVYKYLYSLNTFKHTERIAGLCILCGKEDVNTTENLHDIAYHYQIQINPSAYICTITGNDVYNDTDLTDYIKRACEIFSVN